MRQWIHLSRTIYCAMQLFRVLKLLEKPQKKKPDFKVDHLHIEWEKMASTRDKMIHDYFGVDYEIVWDIVENKIPDLDHFINEIIKENSI